MSKAQDDQLDQAVAAMLLQRRKKLEPLKRFDENKTFVSTWSGFTEEIAIFLPIQHYEETQMTLGDFQLPAPGQANPKAALAAVLRIASEPNTGTQQGSFSEGPTASHCYSDILGTMQNCTKPRPKVRIVIQWMLRDPNLSQPMVPRNVAGVLIVARALDPCYRFGDAVSNVILSNNIISSLQLQRSVNKYHTTAINILGDIYTASQKCLKQFSLSELLTMAVYPELFIDPMMDMATKAISEAEKKTRDDTVRFSKQRAPKPATGKGGAVAADLSAQADAEEQALMRADHQSKQRVARDPPPEKKLFDAFGMNGDAYHGRSLNLRADSLANSNPFVHKLAGFILHGSGRPPGQDPGSTMFTAFQDEESRAAMKKLDSNVIETSFCRYVEFIEMCIMVFRPDLDKTGLVSEFVKEAENNDAKRIHSAGSLNHAKFGICNLLTLSSALERARRHGAHASLCDLRDYYAPEFVPFDAEFCATHYRAAGRIFIGNFKQRDWRHMKQGTPIAVTEFDDNTTAPWRGVYPYAGKFCVQVESQYAHLSALENYQVPWTATTFEHDLQTAYAQGLKPSSDSVKLVQSLNASARLRRGTHVDDTNEKEALAPIHIVESDYAEMEQDATAATSCADQIKSSATMSFKTSVMSASDIPYQHMLNSGTFKPNLEHLRDTLEQHASKMRVLQEVNFSSYLKLLPEYRKYCAMEYERMLRSCAYNNGTAMNSMYAYNKINTQRYFGCRMVGTNLSIFGNSVAHTIRALFHEAGIIQETQAVLLFLISRGNAFDVTSSQLHFLQVGDPACSKSFNTNVVMFFSIPGLVVEEGVRSRMAGTDASAESYRIVITDEAAAIISNGKPSTPADEILFNILRMLLSEGRISSNRSLSGKASMLVTVHQRMMMWTSTNMLKHNHTDPSLQMRFGVIRYLLPFVSVNTGGSLMIRQFTMPSNGKSLAMCRDMMKKLLCNQHAFQTYYFGAVTSNAVPEPNLVLIATVMPTIMNMIGGLVPRIERYVRYAAQARSFARQAAVWRAWYLMSCTPLGAQEIVAVSDLAASPNRKTTNTTPIDTLFLQRCAPHAICTLEMTAYVALMLLDQMWPVHLYAVMFCAAASLAKWRRSVMSHLFTFSKRVTGHHTVATQSDAFSAFQTTQRDVEISVRDPKTGDAMQISIGKRAVLYTIGMTHTDYGRQSASEMPNFWRDEELFEDQICRTNNAFHDSAVLEKVTFEQTTGSRINPNYVAIKFENVKTFNSTLFELIQCAMVLPQRFVNEAVQKLSCTQSVTLTLPALRSEIETSSPLEWDRTSDGKIRYTSIPVWRMENQVVFISTVFLYLSAPRYLRMHILRSLENDQTDPEKSWVLPFTVKNDVSIVDTIRLKRRQNEYVVGRNPMYISQSDSYTARALASNWIQVLMHSNYDASADAKQPSSAAKTASKLDLAVEVAYKEHVFGVQVAEIMAATDACVKKHIQDLEKKYPQVRSARLLTCRPTEEIVPLNGPLTPDDEAFWFAEMPNIIAGLVSPSAAPSVTEGQMESVLIKLRDAQLGVSGTVAEKSAISKILNGKFPIGFGQCEENATQKQKLIDDDGDEVPSTTTTTSTSAPTRNYSDDINAPTDADYDDANPYNDADDDAAYASLHSTPAVFNAPGSSAADTDIAVRLQLKRKEHKLVGDSGQSDHPPRVRIRRAVAPSRPVVYATDDGESAYADNDDDD